MLDPSPPAISHFSHMTEDLLLGQNHQQGPTSLSDITFTMSYGLRLLKALCIERPPDEYRERCGI